MLEMHRAGAVNLAQAEESCVVFGMPAEAIKLGGVDRVLPLDRMAAEIVRPAPPFARASLLLKVLGNAALGAA
jgi:two-component system chemotaxis response regulator CheB